MLDIPSLDGLGWSKVRALARTLTTAAAPDAVYAAALPLLDAPDPPHRMLGVYLLGFTAGARPAHLDVLRQRVPNDASWEVQEALAQAFDACCAAVGYAASLAVIDGWLSAEQANLRRAVSEGLRPWTSKSRPYFAAHPEEAVRRLAALRADASDYVRHSAGNALRDIRRKHPTLVDAETAAWNLADPAVRFTYERVLRQR